MDAHADDKRYTQPSEPPRGETVAEPAYSEDGVDLTLIRWMLSLTPAERLGVLQSAVTAIEKLRNARIVV